ncbi:type II secretion system F family protein [Clostridium mediterraneense]|uniref:type II secretion system F family protein n=1 Tax=Clostridium mediterraneense TaxID=1805472 RepID=UPI00082D4F9C|nr:type II secretion system F family protein [Clostridium mediterraneense]
MINLRKKVDYESILYVCTSMESYISAGLQFVKSMELIEIGLNNKAYRESIERVVKRIKEGESIALAFSDEGDLYTSMFIDMLFIGEESGQMENVLKNMTIHFKKKAKLKKQVNSALLYPKFIGLAMLGVILLFLDTILPTIASMYEGLQVKSSFLTRTIISMNKFFEDKNVYILFLGSILIGFLIYISLKKVLKDKDVFARFKLRKNYKEVNFIYILNLILTSGVPLISALERLIHSVEDRSTRNYIEKMTNELRRGESILDSISGIDIISPVTRSFILSGEKSGKLDNSTTNLVNILENNFNNNLKSYVSKIEPITLCALGILVLGLSLIVFIPMYEYMNYV